MFDFVAIGPGVKQQWRRRLSAGDVIRLGRSPKEGWAVPWDMRISREHADIALEGGQLRVRCLDGARNAIYVHGEPTREFSIGPGEDFRIGRTRFLVECVDSSDQDSENRPENEASDNLSVQDLAQQPLQQRLESLLSCMDQPAAESPAEPLPKPSEAGASKDSRPSQSSKSELDDLRAQVESLRQALEDSQQPAGPTPAADSGIYGQATVDGHILDQDPGPDLNDAGPPEEPYPAEAIEPPAVLPSEVNGKDASEDSDELETDLGLPIPDDLLCRQSAISGAAFGNYDLFDQIYSGGTGQILAAKHHHMDRIAAIKILSREATQSEEMLDGFHRKAKIMAQFDHPNLVKSYDAGELDGTQYLIMEYIDGVDLVNVLKRKTLDVPTAVEYIIQAAQGLSYAHQKQIVHRNLNPGHLLVTRQGVIKVIGWGLAKQLDDTPEHGLESASKMIGTLDYMSPEQIVNSQRVDERADIYSLGCTLFALLTKRVVFPVDWYQRKVTAQCYQPPPSLQELRSDASESLDNVYQKMLAKRPRDRYRTMREVVDALVQVV